MSVTEIEQRWLAHAWAVFHTSGDHFRACPGVQADSGDALDLDPGYVGVNYPPGGGGVVCVGLADGKAEGRAGARRAIPRRDVAEEWVSQGAPPEDDPVAAERFLDQWRVSFVDDLNRWPWWRQHFDEIVRFSGRRQDDVAVVNLALCRQRADGEGVKLAKACSAQQPIAATLAIFRPAALLVAGKDAWVRNETEGLAGFVEHWNAMIPTEGHADAQNWRVQVGRRTRLAIESWGSARTQDETSLTSPPTEEAASNAGTAGESHPSTFAGELPDRLGPRYIPGRSRSGIQRGLVDVVVDLDLLGERTEVHERLVEQLHDLVAAAGHLTFADSVGPDLAWREGDRVVVAEVKTLPDRFDRHQLRLGLGQVLEYRSAAVAESGLAAKAVLWVERAPADESLWLKTCRAAAVRLCWPGGPSPLEPV